MATSISIAGCTIKSYVPPVFNICEKEISTRTQTLCALPKPIYSTQDHANAIYVRNPQCWCYDLSEQLTCCSPWNSYGINQRAGTLITPRHIVYAKHFPIQPGSTIRFVTANNQVITRTVTLTANDGTPAGSNPDIDVGLLNEDVPDSIKPCYFLPDNYLDYLSYKNIPPLSGTFIPYRPGTISLDQEEKALISDFLMFTGNPSTGVSISPVAPPKTNKSVLWESIIGGDSGNPMFLIYEGKLILITTWLTSSSGSNYIYYKNMIHDLIDQLDTQAGDITGHRVQQVSFERSRIIKKITRTDIKLYNNL
jgi:hypothetical protein